MMGALVRNRDQIRSKENDRSVGEKRGRHRKERDPDREEGRGWRSLSL